MQRTGEPTKTLLLGDAETGSAQLIEAPHFINGVRFATPERLVVDYWGEPRATWVTEVNEQAGSLTLGAFGQLPSDVPVSWDWERSLSPDGERIYYATEDEAGAGVFSLSLTDAEPTPTRVSDPVSSDTFFMYTEEIADARLLFYKTRTPIEGSTSEVKGAYLQSLIGDAPIVNLEDYPPLPAAERVELHRPAGLPYLIHHAWKDQNSVLFAIPIADPTQGTVLMQFPRYDYTKILLPPTWPPAP